MSDNPELPKSDIPQNTPKPPVPVPMPSVPEIGIPPEQETTLPSSQPIQGQNNKKETFFDKLYTGEWLFAFVTFVIRFGWDMSVSSHNELACVCWLITLLIALHIIWVWTKSWRDYFPLKILRIVIISGIHHFIFVVARKPVIDQYRVRHTPPDQTNEKVLSTVSDVKNSLTGLSDILSKSPNVAPVAQLGILSNEDSTLSNDENTLEQPHPLVYEPTIDVGKLEQEGNTKRAELLVEERRQQIQQQMDDIKNKQQAEQDAKTQQQQEQKQQDEFLNEEKAFTELNESIFDFTIWELGRYLQVVSQQTGQGIWSDFRGNAPTLYSSQMISNGVFIIGTNYISVGTNTEWNYSISTSIFPIDDRDHVLRPNNYAILNIYAQNTNGGCSLSVSPQFNVLFDSPLMIKRFKSNKIKGKIWVRNISLAVNAPIMGNLNYSISIKNYTNEIDTAVRQLIEEQLQECPLPLKSH